MDPEPGRLSCRMQNNEILLEHCDGIGENLFANFIYDIYLYQNGLGLMDHSNFKQRNLHLPFLLFFPHFLFAKKCKH